MNFKVKEFGSGVVDVEIKLHDGRNGDGVDVYSCAYEGDLVYFEAPEDAQIWEILNAGLLAVKEFRKEGQSPNG